MGLISSAPIPPIVPDARAIQTATYLRLIIVVHFLVALCEFFTVNWFAGVIECIFAGFGLASIRSNLGYRAHWLRCYFWFCMASLIVDFLFVILFYTGVFQIDRKWRQTAFQIVSFVGISVLICGYYFGRKLWYQLLEIIRNDIEGAMHMGHQPGAAGILGVANAYPVQNAGSAQSYPMQAECQPETTANAVPATVQIMEAVPVAQPARAATVQPYVGSGRRLARQ
ncbi:hypothetical protein AAMO2058_000048700 [Amorphochlora amoebiformis]